MTQGKKGMQPENLTKTPLPPGWVSAYAVMAYFQICKRTLWLWHRKGLPKYQIGKIAYYKVTDIDNLIERHRKVARKTKASKK